ncbi:MAG: plasmid replication initiator TrfA [Methylococcaceae bacterium]|jgi:hypothetical protein
MTNELEQTNKKLANLEQKSLKRNQDKAITLPEWPDSKRGTPNSFLRSALFTTADCKKERIYLHETILASQAGISISFTGPQLNQEDLTLWETLVHLAKEQPLGNVCEFTAYEILKTLKLPLGGDGYKRLEQNIIRLAKPTVTIAIGWGKFAGHLIESVALDEKTHHYKIELGKGLIKLYSETTWIDIDQRLKLRGKSLAQYLHGYYSSHKISYPVKVDTLYKLSDSRIKELRKFKQNLIAAHEELIKIGYLESFSIENDLVSIIKK